MHQVVIVEDEVLARTHLLELIAWEDHGYRICGVFDSGLTAIKQLQRLQPDIIISDVYMPGMDGIELSSHLKTAQLAAKLIMLSSYDSYDYVRETFNNGAVDYLLKDRLSTETLLSALDKARSGIEGKEVNQRNPAAAEKGPFMLQTYADAKRSIVRNWLFGIEQDKANLQEQMNGLELDFSRHAAVVLSLKVTNADLLLNRFSDKEKESWVLSLLSLHEQNLAGTMVHIDQSRFAILYKIETYRSELKGNEEVQQYAKRVSALLGKFMNVKLIYGTSAPCQDVHKLNKAFLSAIGQIEPSYAPSEGQLQLTNEAGSEQLMAIGIREEKELLTALVSMDVHAAEDLIRSLYRNISPEDPACKVKAEQITSELIALARKASRQLGDQADSHMQLQVPLHIPDLTAEASGLPEEAVVKLYIELIDRIKTIQMHGASPYVRKAISCIRDRYREDLSLGEAASHIGIHPVYLSRLFRQEMEITFVEYLNKVRIEAAKTMMSSGMKIKDIYEQVGFNHYNYFFKVFKAIEGLTPAEYEKRKISNNESR